MFDEFWSYIHEKLIKQLHESAGNDLQKHNSLWLQKLLAYIATTGKQKKLS